MNKIAVLLMLVALVDGADVMTVDATGQVVVAGSSPTVPAATEVRLGAGKISTGGTVTINDTGASALRVSGGAVVQGAVSAANLTVSRSSQASATEAVRGDDPRLSDARPANGGNASTLGGQPASAFAPAAGAMPTGALTQFAGATAPSGWFICDGSAVSRSTYAALFAVIGTTYGAGDGSSTFNLPDLRGRMAVGAGQGSGLTARAIGQTGGEEAHKLTIAEMPSHSHMSGGWHGTGNYDDKGNGIISWENVGSTPNAVGGDQAHNIMAPFVVLNFIIKQ